jgi:hypothetical protein
MPGPKEIAEAFDIDDKRRLDDSLSSDETSIKNGN